MQPYLFPYIGYFMLMKESDIFIFHDDVQYIKGGWINRNRILSCEKVLTFTFPLKKGHSKDKINEKVFSEQVEKASRKLINQLEVCYSKAPHFTATMELISNILNTEKENISTFITASLIAISEHIGIDVDFNTSSIMSFDKSLSASDRVIDIVHSVGGDRYVNPFGGKTLYEKEQFASKGLALQFLLPRITPYPQVNAATFEPNLSIIDVLMNVGASGAEEILREYSLVE